MSGDVSEITNNWAWGHVLTSTALINMNQHFICFGFSWTFPYLPGNHFIQTHSSYFLLLCPSLFFFASLHHSLFFCHTFLALPLSTLLLWQLVGSLSPVLLSTYKQVYYPQFPARLCLSICEAFFPEPSFESCFWTLDRLLNEPYKPFNLLT